MTHRRFHVSDLLSVTHERLVSTRGMGGVYDILSWLTGVELWTTQLPAAARAVQPVLLQRFPKLASLTVPDEFCVNKATAVAEIEMFVRQGADLPGEYVDLDPIPDAAAKLAFALGRSQ